MVLHRHTWYRCFFLGGGSPKFCDFRFTATLHCLFPPHGNVGDGEMAWEHGAVRF